MNPVLRILAPIAALIALSAAAATTESSAGIASNVDRLLEGRWDNRAQSSAAPTESAQPIPHVSLAIEPTPKAGFALWHVRIVTGDGASYEQTWAMEARAEHDGSGALIPYYQFKQTETPTAARFDPDQWLSLEACALRGAFGGDRIEGAAEGEPCVAVSMSVGARRALLPVGLLRAGDALGVDLNLRNARTRIDLRRER